MTITEVKERLEQLGFSSEDINESALSYAIERASETLKNKINLDEIPEGLHYKSIDMACAEFLRTMKGFGLLDSVEFEQIAQSVSEGDTSVTFVAGASPEQKFDAVVERLGYLDTEEIYRFRVMEW